MVTFSSFVQIIEFCSCLSSAFKAKFSKQSLGSALERLVCGQLLKNSDCFGWMHPSWLCIQHMSEKDPGQSHANEFLANLKPMSPLGKKKAYDGSRGREVFDKVLFGDVTSRVLNSYSDTTKSPPFIDTVKTLLFYNWKELEKPLH